MIVTTAKDTGTRIPRPSPWAAPKLSPTIEPRALVARHPAGGWTHAVRINEGTARVYVGHYATARQAARAL